MKITIVGAGAVGASCAEYIAIKDFASEVVLLDIREGFAEGKAIREKVIESLTGKLFSPEAVSLLKEGVKI